jgi:DNA polymerase IV
VARIAHLDVDAFYASVELLRRPELRGKPVIVSGTGPRAVVTTASYEARRFGVGSAMPTARALRLCPAAVLIPPDFDAYRAASRRVWQIVGAHVDRVEQVGLDEGYLDLDGLVSPRAAVRRIVVDVHAATGLTVSVGIGPNKLVAKVASDAEKPRGFVVLSREEACARFAEASPGLVPGIGPKTVARLDALGLSTLGALAGAPEELLTERFGPNLGRELARRARFEHAGTVQTVREAKSQSSETTFDTDVGDRGTQERAIADLARDLAGRLGRRDLRGRTIGIKVRLDDWTTVTRARTLDHATNDVEVIAPIALDLLRAYDPPRPVRLLGVRVAGFERPPEPRDAPHGQLQLAL